MRTLRERIDRLEAWYPKLFLQPHLVAAVAVLSDYSTSPASIQLRCENISNRSGALVDFRLALSWPATLVAKAERLRATMQRSSLVEFAATAVALVVAHCWLDLGELDVTAIGERADFRSLRRRHMLEISGTELSAEFERRHRQKVVQALQNPFGWDAYVVVCLFSAKGHRVRVSRHEYPEESNE